MSLHRMTGKIPQLWLVRVGPSAASPGLMRPRRDGLSLALAFGSYLPMVLIPVHRSIRSVSHSSRFEVTPEEIHNALRVLNLSPTCTDADIKTAFQAYAKAKHPDMQTNNRSGKEGSTTSAGSANDAMIIGTQAYQLLRKLSKDDRQFILRQSSPSDQSGGYSHTGESHARAQRAYEGTPRHSSRYPPGGARHAQQEEGDWGPTGAGADFSFSRDGGARTSEDRARTAQFNAYCTYREAMRRQRPRTSGSGASVSAGPANRGSMFSLYFFQHSREALQRLHARSTSEPGFAGMDGSRFDSSSAEARASRSHHSMTNPATRIYLLARQRAQEKAMVDHACPSHDSGQRMEARMVRPANVTKLETAVDTTDAVAPLPTTEIVLAKKLSQSTTAPIGSGSVHHSPAVPCMNGTVGYLLEDPIDACYPTEKAAEAAREAFLIARQYHRLFFENTEETTASTVGVLPKRDLSCGPPISATTTPTEWAAGTRDNPLASRRPSVAGSLVACSHNTDGLSQCHPCGGNSEPERTAASLMRYTPYHTFFPPPLSCERRATILRYIIGGPIRSFSQWRWRKAEEYFHLHVRNVHSNNIYDDDDASPGGRNSAASESGLRGKVTGEILHVRRHRPQFVPTQDTVATNGEMPSVSALPVLAGSSTTLDGNHVNHSPAQVPGGGSCVAPDGNSVMSTLCRLQGTPTSSCTGVSAASPTSHTRIDTSVATSSRDECCSCPPSLLTRVDPDTYLSDTSMYAIPTSHQGPEYFRSSVADGTKTLIIVMVGLPARGKTFLAQKICRLLGWHGCRAKVQNVQVAWRRALLDREVSQRIVEELRQTYSTHDMPIEGRRGESASAEERGAADAMRPDSIVSAVDARGSSLSSVAAVVSACSLVSETKRRHVCASMLPYTRSDTSSDAGETEYTISGGTALMRDVKGASERSSVEKAKLTDRPLDARQSSLDHHGAESFRRPPAAGKGGANYLCAEHFRSLVRDPNSMARSLYKRVLQSFAADCRRFFEHGGDVLVLNDDFVTEELRQEAESLFLPLASQMIYMEVIRGAEENKRYDACKVRDPTEYPNEHVSPSEAERDYEERVAFLESVYEPLGDTIFTSSSSDALPCPNRPRDNFCAVSSSANKLVRQPRMRKSYIRIRDTHIIETHGVSGYMASRVVSYVMNLSQAKMQHPIYFVRHGQSCYNLEDRLGGNPMLTEQGMRDASALLEFVASLKEQMDEMDRVGGIDSSAASSGVVIGNPSHEVDSPTGKGQLTPRSSRLEIWTSQLRRAVQTAELSERLLDIPTLHWSSLNEIHAGVCEDLTYDEVRDRYPLIDHFRKQSKYTFRYPEGESYQDLANRLEPVIMELENADKVVIVVAHQAVLRCLLAYFGSTSAESSVSVSVPHRAVWRCTYDSNGIASLDELTLDNAQAGLTLTRPPSNGEDKIMKK